MGFFKSIGNAITKPFKEAGQEVLKGGTTVLSGGTVRYDEDQGFREGFVTKTALKETGKLVGNVMNLAQNNTDVVDAAGLYFGVPNASSFLDRKEVAPQQTQAAPVVVQAAAPQAPQQNKTMIIVAIAALGLIMVLFISKKR